MRFLKYAVTSIFRDVYLAILTASAFSIMGGISLNDAKMTELSGALTVVMILLVVLIGYMKVKAKDKKPKPRKMVRQAVTM